ncbi:MAG: SDR family oxidoreductase [Lachnospiraceae bacterium]|nr:SDR family oxidoreductase [Lachnospiraceae bacterium]
MFEVAGKRILVTGSTQGIGRAAAAAFAAAGASVWIHGSRKEKTEKASQSIGFGTRPAWADLSEDGCAQRLYEKTGDVDILILNASVQYRKAWDAITAEEFDTQLHVNLKSSLELIQKYVPAMQAQGWGRIITIGSVQQFVPHKDMAVYAASKSALYALVRNLAKQLAPCGITVNNVAPGAMATPRNADVVRNPDYMKKVVTGIPAGYMGAEDDCNGACFLLASEEGRYITGANLCVDGGMSL